MNQPIHRYLAAVLKRRFDMEFQRWNSALESGFDVAVVATDFSVAHALEDYLVRCESSKVHPTFMLRVVPQEMSSSSQFHLAGPASAHTQTKSLQPPLLTLYKKRPVSVLAAIVFELPEVSGLLPSPAAMVSQVLESAKIERYLDVFDGRKMTQLRKVLEVSGPEVFFDTIIQVAYLAGYRGDDLAAERHLETVFENQDKSQARSSQRLMDSPQGEWETQISKLFERFIQLPDPHDVLKAMLAHYVIHSRKVTQAEASRILKVSRSTLQAHLQLAERLKVIELFSQDKSHA